MKKLWWILINIGASVLILLLMLLIPVIWLDKSWWWFFGTLIGLVIAWLITGLIILLIKLSRRPIPEPKLDVKGAEARAIHEFKYDEHNPDNFHITKRKQLAKIGEKGAEKTPVYIMEGKGTENNDKRVAIVNLNSRKEMTFLIDPTPEQIKEAQKLIAEHPPEEETKEEITTGTDIYGRPITTTKIRRPSQTEKKIEEEKKEVEETAGI